MDEFHRRTKVSHIRGAFGVVGFWSFFLAVALIPNVVVGVLIIGLCFWLSWVVYMLASGAEDEQAEGWEHE